MTIIREAKLPIDNLEKKQNEKPPTEELFKEGFTIIENTITHEEIVKSTPVSEEVIFGGGVMITETDSKGIITYANRKFREMTGFSKEQLIGAPHSINRHPDMPKGAFRGMWKTISDKKIWRGYVKNMRKDGKFYWVLVYIQPKVDENKKIIGYIAVGKVAYPSEIKAAEETYMKLQGDDHIDDEAFLSNYGQILSQH